MPSASRNAPGGQVYHVLNRAVGRMHLFAKEADFDAFRRVLAKARRRHPIGILASCLPSNPWHFLVGPEADGQVTASFRWGQEKVSGTVLDILPELSLELKSWDVRAAEGGLLDHTRNRANA